MPHFPTYISPFLKGCIVYMFTVIASHAQPYEPPKLFLNCAFTCYDEYLRSELPHFKWVRDRLQCDIEVFVNGQESGNGGSRYAVSLRGKGRYVHVSDSMTFFVYNFDSEDQKRSKLLKSIQLGLLRNMDLGMAYQMSHIEFIKSKEDTSAAVDHDPWNNFVFHLGTGLKVSGESNRRSAESWTWLVMNRVTHVSKINSWLEYNFNQNKFTINDNVVNVQTINIDGRVYYVKSLSNHWSAGGILQYYSSVFSNIKSMGRAAPVVEYNIFPFAQSMKQQLRFAYQAGGFYQEYFQTTIFDHTSEYRGYHRLSVILDLTKPWGTIRASLNGTTMLTPYDQAVTVQNTLGTNRLALANFINLRVAKGLSVQLTGSAALVNDQISLARASVDQNAALLRGAQLATTFTYDTYVELNYTFGSINNSVVNPRIAQVE